jgi:hypothetical protein
MNPKNCPGNRSKSVPVSSMRPSMNYIPCEKKKVHSVQIPSSFQNI